MKAHFYSSRRKSLTTPWRGEARCCHLKWGRYEVGFFYLTAYNRTPNWSLCSSKNVRRTRPIITFACGFNFGERNTTSVCDDSAGTHNRSLNARNISKLKIRIILPRSWRMGTHERIYLIETNQTGVNISHLRCLIITDENKRTWTSKEEKAWGEGCAKSVVSTACRVCIRKHNKTQN